MKAEYFTEPCKACFRAEMEDIPLIKMRYVVERVNPNFEPKSSRVRVWREQTDGTFPSVRVVGRGKSEWYIGKSGCEKLAEKCREWDEEKNLRRRELISPIEGGVSV